MGPWSCSLCPPGTRLACVKCAMKGGGHLHLDVLDRTGARLRQVPVCRTCAARLAGDIPTRPADAHSRRQGRRDPRRTWLDRTYRQAVAQLRQRHADEFAELLTETRSF